MHRSRQIKIGVLIILMVFTIGLTLAYSALSTKLNVTGTGHINDSLWKVKFQNVTAQAIGAGEYKLPIVNESTLSDYQVTFTKPGDGVTFYFDVSNVGTINAKLSKMTNSTPKCEGVLNSATAASDSKLVCSNLIYEIKYQDGTNINENDMLNAKETRKIKLTIQYNPMATTLPNDDVVIKNLNTSMIYVQA